MTANGLDDVTPAGKTEKPRRADRRSQLQLQKNYRSLEEPYRGRPNTKVLT